MLYLVGLIVISLVGATIFYDEREPLFMLLCGLLSCMFSVLLGENISERKETNYKKGVTDYITGKISVEYRYKKLNNSTFIPTDTIITKK
jgi:hypothetical protein